MKRHVLILALSLAACSSSPSNDRPEPPWISQPTRNVDNGYIVYIGTGEEVSTSDAILAAEGMAIQDLANECSFIPKGARVEDKFNEKLKNTYKAYVKVAVEMQICDEASKTTDPSKIKELASVPFTEELKRYEDSLLDHRDEVVDSGIPADQLTEPQGGHTAVADHVHFFMARQYVVYQNTTVILSPPTAYAPGSTEAVAYAASVKPVIRHLENYAAQNPDIKKTPPTWSEISPKVREQRPQAFRNRPASFRPIRNRPEVHRGSVNKPPRPMPSKGRRGRRRRFDETPEKN